MGGEAWSACPSQYGLTLVELMVAMAMVAIVLAIGIPEYQNFTTSNTLLAELHTLKGDIALARSEAATLGSNVVICPSSNPNNTNPSCSGANQWNAGWVILATNSNTSCSTSNSPAPLKVQDAFLSENTVVFTPSATTSLCFNRNGLPVVPTAATLSGMFVFNTPNNNAGDRLCLGINGTGHLNILANGQGGCS